jgi:NitT/TauT family transport system substrate-binding protein
MTWPKMALGSHQEKNGDKIMIKRQTKLGSILGIAGAVALVLSGCASSTESVVESSPAEPDVESNSIEAQFEPAELTFALAAAVLGPKEEVATFAVAEAMGYFAEENLTVTVVNTDGSSAAIQAVAAGSADYTAADAGSILAAVQSDTDIIAIGGLVQNWPWQMATLKGSDIKDAADLEGKNIGVISLASGSYTFSQAFIAGEGLDPDTGANYLPVGVGASAVAALESGQIDAIALYSQLYASLENEGMEFNYIDNGPAFDGLRSITFAASAKAVAADPEVYERLLRASYKAMLFTANNPEAAMQIGYKAFPSLLASETVEARLANDVNSLNAWMRSATPKTGEPAEFTDWGSIPEVEWDATQSYLALAGIISAPVELERAWFPGLLAGANTFDSAEVVKAAADWKP